MAEMSLLVAPLDLSRRDGAGLALLTEARRLASSDRVSPWDYAIEVEHLLKAGLTVNDLRHFLTCGWIQHAEECTTARNKQRQFRPLPEHALGARTCFVLTEAGATAAEALTGPAPNGRLAAECIRTEREPHVRHKPQWHPLARSLTFSGQIVKCFRGRARDQMALLNFFEGRSWPTHVEDALTALEGINRKKRLHDAIRRLNIGQVTPLVRFHGYAEGRGIWWEIIGFPNSDSMAIARRPRAT